MRPDGQAVLERFDLALSPADQLELVVDVTERLLQDLPAPDRVVHAAAPLGAQLGPGALGRDELAQVIQGETEQVLEVEHRL